MQIHADLRQRAVAVSDELPWVDSPLPGVQRRMLERDGDEVARATSIVRYAPNSSFDPHQHALGEEFLVLDGVFSDEMGDFPAGMYVRNPPGSGHRPHTDGGCTIFVKLRQFALSDKAYVRVDTTDQSAWEAGPIEGLEVLRLHAYGDEEVMMLRMRAGTAYASHEHPGGEEIFVVDGAFEDEQGRYSKGTWVRYPAGSAHTPSSRQGCTLYLKKGHLHRLAGR